MTDLPHYETLMAIAQRTLPAASFARLEALAPPYEAADGRFMPRVDPRSIQSFVGFCERAQRYAFDYAPDLDRTPAGLLMVSLKDDMFGGMVILFGTDSMAQCTLSSGGPPNQIVGEARILQPSGNLLGRDDVFQTRRWIARATKRVLDITVADLADEEAPHRIAAQVRGMLGLDEAIGPRASTAYDPGTRVLSVKRALGHMGMGDPNGFFDTAYADPDPRLAYVLAREIAKGVKGVHRDSKLWMDVEDLVRSRRTTEEVYHDTYMVYEVTEVDLVAVCRFLYENRYGDWPHV